LDATRCLGSVNQVDGMVPDDMRASLGDRLFGCDVCQDVCPHNISARRGLHVEFAPLPPMGAGPDLAALIAMTDAEFDAWFAPTAAAWRGPATLQRNAAVALGNSAAAPALPVLQRAVQHAEPVVRAHAAWGLGNLARHVPAVASAARQTLQECLHQELDATVRGELERAMEVVCRS
jgi:epoxyqueuosine reductase